MQRVSAGLVIAAAGVALIVVGLLVWSGARSWFGRLPGDIRIVRPGLTLYVPITSMLIISAVLSLLTTLLRGLR